MRTAVKVAAGIFIFVILFLTAISLQWLEFTRKPLPVPPQGLMIDYLPGDSLNTFAQQLKQQGLIKRAWFFIVLARIEGVDRHLHAGEYRLVPGITPQMLLNKLVTGDVVQHVFRIGEGWTIKQVVDMVNQSNDFRHSTPLITEDSLKSILAPKSISLEGWLFPDTYFFPPGSNDMNFFKRAYSKMQHVMREEWESRAPDLLYKTPEEALIMASIVEKETGVPEERSKVAGVFLRRLQKNMPLQADPTVIYGLGDKYQGKLTKDDLNTPTPYNTYTQQGLPPTPIAIPSRAAIHAALHPDNDSTLYFVAKGDGTHEFSNNLNDHNSAVKRYIMQQNAKTTTP